MIKYFLVFLISLPVFSAVRLEMKSNASFVEQGELLPVELIIDPASAQGLELQKLKGATLAETIYVYEVSPLFRRAGQEHFLASAKIIFIKVPESNKIVHSLQGSQIELFWGSIKVTPTEAPPKYFFGEFEVPRPSNLFWLLTGGIVFLVLASFGGWRISRSCKEKKAQKERLQTLKEAVLGCRSYEEVVELWKKKHQLFKVFPHIQEPFARLEDVLNRCQFKPAPSETEKRQVIESYRKFQSSVEGGFIGI